MIDRLPKEVTTYFYVILPLVFLLRAVEKLTGMVEGASSLRAGWIWMRLLKHPKAMVSWVF